MPKHDMPKHDSITTDSKTSSRKKPPIDAIHMLKEDHRKVEALFDQFFKEKAGRKPQIADQIFHELEVHSTLEEELFYPALLDPSAARESASAEQGEDTSDELDESDELEAEREEENDGVGEVVEVDHRITDAYDEHNVVRGIIAQLRLKDASSPEFQQTMMELQQTVADHVFEEEDELFAEAQLTVDTITLGMHMQQRKQDILLASI